MQEPSAGGSIFREDPDLDAVRARIFWQVGTDPWLVRVDRFAAAPDMVARLEAKALASAGAQLAVQLGRPYRAAPVGGRVEGRYARTLDIGDKRYALIERAKDFTLLPWRPVLEKRLGQQVAGHVRGASISWSFGKDRGPSI